jgi:glycerophosphoryl diester phosphodiesterase
MRRILPARPVGAAARHSDRTAMAQPRHTPLKVGHKGAGRLAPANALAGLRAAAELGLDMTEFDVVRRPGDGRIVLAYSPTQARLTARPTLDEALDVLRGTALRLDVDLKQPGIEAEVARALAAAGLTDRALVTARRPDALRRTRAADPRVALGWSIGRTWHARMVGARTVPGAIARALATGLGQAVMLHHPLVTPAALAAAGGAEVFAWTVNRPGEVARLTALGVSGIVTDDPRLLA